MNKNNKSKKNKQLFKKKITLSEFDDDDTFGVYQKIRRKGNKNFEDD
jgi:uncharacterized protein (UPF0303 family)